MSKYVQYVFETLLFFFSLFFSPVIPLKSELSYKILERGRMRFWLQAEEISSNVTYKFFANDKELSGADVRDALTLTGCLQRLVCLQSAACLRQKSFLLTSPFPVLQVHFTSVFFRSPIRWVMTSRQALLSSSWTISLRRMREHTLARSLMEVAKGRALWC